MCEFGSIRLKRKLVVKTAWRIGVLNIEFFNKFKGSFRVKSFNDEFEILRGP